MRHLFCCLLLMPLVANAQIYRWTDAEGRVHFSATPREGAEQVTVKPQVVDRDEATREREARTAKFYDARRQEQEAEDNRAAQAREQQQKKCGELREKRDQLTHSGPFYHLDERGERQYYTDAEIESFRSKLDGDLARACN
ncbi:DUF4124 domain-containing protein [Metapseudomonas resinovorans]|uniref:DUF4124 domain-containing protein n=1 Tax=Metapseudomonas resinovorans NBRC 106553 TaxID=1245471 RepID=S6AN51_METRE|nr:DUF4124 domain-containing protein [Pseudomonas resinovorans]BAN50375.1 hypothetical protein PCA10_46430 [Pseudomonas resinovorans NBRC 106553]